MLAVTSLAVWRRRIIIRGLLYSALALMAFAGLIPVHTPVIWLFFCFAMLTLGLIFFSIRPKDIWSDRLLWLLDLSLLAYLVRATGGASSPFTPLAYIWVFGMIILHIRKGLPVPVLSFSLLAFLTINLASWGSGSWLFYTSAQAIQLALISLIGFELLQERGRHQRDPLTKVLTRGAGLEYINDYIQHGRRFHLAFLDLRGFKAINDNMGHAVGDEVLEHLGRRLNTLLRAQDIIMRYGGDEFILVSTDAPLKARIQQALKEPFSTSEGLITLTADIGEEHWQPGADLQTLLKRVDEAMYLNKHPLPPDSKGSNVLI